MNKSTWALLALGLFASTACKSADPAAGDSKANFEVASASVPLTFNITGMT